MKAAAMLACVLVLVAADGQARPPAKCGSTHKQAAVSTVTLAGPRADEGGIPAFYFHNEKFNNVMFFRPGDAVATLREMIVHQEKWLGEGKSVGFREMLAQIEKDIPLEGHTDLNKYALHMPDFRAGAQALVTEMLRAGRASVAYWNYFYPNPTAVEAPAKTLTLHVVEDAAHLFSAEFCSEFGSTVYLYAGELE